MLSRVPNGSIFIFIQFVWVEYYFILVLLDCSFTLRCRRSIPFYYVLCYTIKRNVFGIIASRHTHTHANAQLHNQMLLRAHARNIHLHHVATLIRHEMHCKAMHQYVCTQHTQFGAKQMKYMWCECAKQGWCENNNVEDAEMDREMFNEWYFHRDEHTSLGVSVRFLCTIKKMLLVHVCACICWLDSS